MKSVNIGLEPPTLAYVSRCWAVMQVSTGSSPIGHESWFLLRFP